MNKNEMRQIVLEQRKNLNSEQVRSNSDRIVSTLKKLDFLQKSQFILSYMAYGNEVDLLPLNKWILEQGKTLCIPRVLDGSHMDAVQIDNLQQGLMKSRFGILEPLKESESADIAKLELILVPGLAFDRSGNRLGHGKGYYDRFLDMCGNNTYLIGITFDFQLFDSIPFGPHDKKMNAVVTETGFHTVGTVLPVSSKIFQDSI